MKIPKNLTKQKQFAKAYVKHKLNGTKAALEVYPNQTIKSAGTTAYELLKKPVVQKTISGYLEEAGYEPRESIGRLRTNAVKGAGIKATASDSIRADELLLKLSGGLIDRSQSVHFKLQADLGSMDKYELLKLKNKYDKLLKG